MYLEKTTLYPVPLSHSACPSVANRHARWATVDVGELVAWLRGYLRSETPDLRLLPLPPSTASLPVKACLLHHHRLKPHILLRFTD